MSERRSIQGDPTVHSHQHRGSERNDSSVICEIAAVIENLNNEQWMAVTAGMSYMDRLNFVEMCGVMISGLSQSAYQMFKPIVQILGSTEPQKSLGTAAGSPESSLKRSPLDIPFVRSLCMDILQEVKGACLEAIKKISLSGPLTGLGVDGFMYRCVQLKEETVKGFFSRLDALDLYAKKPDAGKLSDVETLKALGATDVTQEVVTAILSVMERSCLDHASVTAAANLSQVVARMVKTLASPKPSEILIGSYYTAMEKVPPIHLTSDFQVQVHKAVLHVLLSSAQSWPLVGSQFIPKPWENAVLAYLTTARTILMNMVDSVLKFLAATEVGKKRFCTDAIQMFSKVQDLVKQFMALGTLSALPVSERSVVAQHCVNAAATERDSGGDDQPAASCESSLGKETCASQKPTTVGTATTKDVRDVLPKKMIHKVRKHKKDFCRGRNAVSPLVPYETSLVTNTLRGSHLQENLNFTSSVAIISDGSGAPAARSQMENSSTSDAAAAAEKPKKRNIFTRFFLSVTKPLQTCIKSSERT